MPTREAVMTALLAKLATINPPFASISRRIVLDPDKGPTASVATPVEQPALCMIEDDETTTHTGHMAPAKRTWRVVLFVWCKIPEGSTPGVPDGVTPGASVINALIESIEGALAPDNIVQGTYTIGGLVNRCWIDGSTQKVSGDLNPSGQCFAAIPLSILVP